MPKRHYQIYASLLAADLMHIGDEALQVTEAGADMLHIDVMDNHYVPNLTFGPLICDSLHKNHPQIKLDVHLMVSPVDTLITECAQKGASRISIHPDATIHLDRSLQLIRDSGCDAGLVLNPATSIDCVEYCIHHLAFVLVMTVNPGFGGQVLIPEVIPKIQALHARYPELSICVDGGINHNNIRQLAFAGASQFVAGAAIFRSIDYSQSIQQMREQLMYE